MLVLLRVRAQAVQVQADAQRQGCAAVDLLLQRSVAFALLLQCGLEFSRFGFQLADDLPASKAAPPADIPMFALDRQFKCEQDLLRSPHTSSP
jgi:hypothetical protein